MTDLEKRAEEYLENKHCKNVCTYDEIEECKKGIRIRCMSFNYRKELIVNFVKDETALLSQHILDLQRDKGNLTDRVRELEKQLIESSKAIGEGAERYVQLEKQYLELEQQVEEMKWHKIADGDIPKVTGDYITNIGVLTYDHYGNNIYKWHTPFCEACDYCDEADADEVIAWCEIPKYTKEIKENDYNGN